jgi:hypothetical protein
MYSLNQFYHEASLLIEKYNYRQPDFMLDCQFSIKQSEGNTPGLNFWICYNHSRWDERSDKRVSACGVTPANVLAEFEEELQQKTGLKLIERVGVELPAIDPK